MDYLGSNNSKLSQTLEINLDNDSVNPNTTPEDIAELKNNEFGESVEATNDQSHQSEQQQQKEVNQGNDGVETTKQTEPNLTLIIAEIQQDNVWRTPEGNNGGIESNHPIEENQTQMTEDYVHPATVFPLPSFSLNISQIQTQDTKKMKRQLADTVDDSKRRKTSDSGEPSSQGVPETLDNQIDKQLSLAVNDIIMLKLRRTERDFKPINYNITPFRAPPNPATSVKPEKHSVYHPFLAPDADKMKIWNQWMHDKNPSTFKVGSYNFGPQWFKFIVDPHQTLYEEHVDAIFEMLSVRRETDPVYFHNNRLPKAAFLKTAFLKKMKNDHYNAEFLKFPEVYEWTDDIVDNAISDQWMEKVDVLYGVVRRNKRWFGMCINIKMHTFTVFNGQDEEVGSSFHETDIKPFAELLSSFLFAIGKDKKYAPFILKSVDRKHCPKRKVATNNGFSVIKQIECHCMGIEDVSELTDTNEVDLRRKMASDIYYHFQYE